MKIKFNFRLIKQMAISYALLGREFENVFEFGMISFNTLLIELCFLTK